MALHSTSARKCWRFGLRARVRGLFIINIVLLGLIGVAFPEMQDLSANPFFSNRDSHRKEIFNRWKKVIDDVDYVVIGWNDLGMHCINPSYKELAILPPFNNLWVQVIKRGEPPQIVTSGITVEYSVINNTTVKDKTDFWDYVLTLFGKDLKPGVGLTGNGLSGTMELAGDHFQANGLPLLPYDDKMNWNPYQLASITVRDASGKVLKKSDIAPVVLPISDEINCAQCHAQDGDGTANINGGTDSVDANILAVHDFYQKTDLSGQTPVLCAGCHADNALGLSGDPKTKPLSQAMHGWHSQFPDAGCYSCHPGAATQCLRAGIAGMGYLGDTPSCPSCHGSSANAPQDYTSEQSCMLNVADSIAGGRQPWLQEPSCEQCHGVNYTTGQELYRNSTGHGGVYCAGCHNSPHAWWPSKFYADNYQPVALQKSPRPIGDCQVCHLTRTSDGNNPHVSYLFGN